MKKLIALLLALSLVLSFTACCVTVPDTGSNSGNDTPAQNNQGNNEGKVDTPPVKEEMTFSELVVVDNDECQIKITDIVEDDFWGFTLKVLLENKSADITYMFSLETAAVNGIQTDPFFSAEVAPGKKSNEEIHFSDDILEDLDIMFTDIELSFRVYDSEDWLDGEIAEETVHVYPYGEENAGRFVRDPQDDDNIIVDNDYATVIVTGYAEDDLWGYTVNLFLVNKSDKNIMFTVDEVSVNGFMADPLFADSVSAGKCAFSSMSWSDSSFEDNGITEVEEIEFLLRAYDDDDWFAEDFVSEVITLNP